MLRVLSTRASTKVRSTASWCLRVWVGSVRAGAAAITAPVRTTTCATTVGTAARARWVRTTTRRGSSRPQGFTPSGRGLAFFRRPASPQEPPGFAPAVFAYWNGRLGQGQSREFGAFGACHGGIALLQDRLADEAIGLRQSGRLAQLVEQLTLNQRVVGSIPTAPTIPLASRRMARITPEVEAPAVRLKSRPPISRRARRPCTTRRTIWSPRPWSGC